MDDESGRHHSQGCEYLAAVPPNRLEKLTSVQLQPGEKYIIDNGHLVAWNCDFVMERAASGGIVSAVSSREGLVCKFKGPGTVFLQSRNPQMLAEWLGAHANIQ